MGCPLSEGDECSRGVVIEEEVEGEGWRIEDRRGKKRAE